MDAITVAHDGNLNRRAPDRAEGAFLGAAVGDALGWPVENRSGRVGGRRDVEPSFEFTAWRRREGGRFSPHEVEILAGSYSDDTQLMLAVARARLAGEAWWRWLTEHELPFWLLYERGGGGATKRAAGAWAVGVAPWDGKDSRRYFEAGGNGVAMRIAPHCLIAESFDDIAPAVMADGITTHGHPRALVGALLQAYAIHRSLTRRDVLGYGELIDETLNADDWRRFRAPTAAGVGWEELASERLSSPYRDVWAAAVRETEEMLEAARDGMAHGALAVDRNLLERIGTFGKSSGAGTVTAVGAVFLASRYAAHPSGGIVTASYAKGGDTDTLAAMTGSILGAIHGTDWLARVSREIEDGQYIRQLARDLINRPATRRDLTPSARLTARSFWRRFGEPSVGTKIEMPGGSTGTVVAINQHTTRQIGVRPVSWVVKIDDGPTLHLKRMLKSHRPAEDAARAPNSREPGRLERSTRIGVVIYSSDLRQSRKFYGQVVGLETTRESGDRIVFENVLALEPLPPSLEQPAGKQLVLGADSASSFEARLAVTLYVESSKFDAIRRRVSDADFPLSATSIHDGRPTFRCHDPDGNVIEFRCMRGD